MTRRMLILICIVSIAICSQAQEENYDESMVPDYVLPELLVSEDGSAVQTADAWEKIRRPEVMGLFQQNVYGKVPDGDYSQSHEVLVHEQNALDGLADRYEIKIS
ncbi:MAG: hypothetical protein KAI95_13845, partial [Bacteroidales bacterium]|nr:hypothetical protein [Bacteroidales bacterium]